MCRERQWKRSLHFDRVMHTNFFFLAHLLTFPGFLSAFLDPSAVAYREKRLFCLSARYVETVMCATVVAGGGQILTSHYVNHWSDDAHERINQFSYMTFLSRKIIFLIQLFKEF
jgi:hypothetical protein